MKRALTPAVTTLEDRLALSTTSPSIVVQPPQITGSIDTLSPTELTGPMEWFTPISPTPILGMPQPVIIPLPTGTDSICHFVALTTTEFVQSPYATGYTQTTVPINLAASALTFYPVSQLT